MWQVIRDFLDWYSATFGIYLTILAFTIILPWSVWRRYLYRLPDGSHPPKPNPRVQAVLGIVLVTVIALGLFAKNRVFG